MASAGAKPQPPSKYELWMRPRSERYLRLEEIGSGSFGKVTLAIDLLGGGRVAIKKQQVDSQACQREFALLSALLAHPSEYVADVLDYYTVTESRKSVMCTVHQLADSTLGHVFESSRGRLHDGVVARYLHDVACGLRHLHALTIVHGDASLKNMLLMRTDRVVVADFGTAYASSGLVLGEDDEITTQYIRSPERLYGAQLMTAEADIWAFGVQLYCLRTGDCPWMLKSEDVAKHVCALERAIGVVPHGSSLRRMPKWAQLQEACAGVTLSESVAGVPWSVQSLGLCTRTMHWDPAERASWEEVLSSQFISMVASPLPAIEK